MVGTRRREESSRGLSLYRPWGDDSRCDYGDGRGVGRRKAIYAGRRCGIRRTPAPRCPSPCHLVQPTPRRAVHRGYHAALFRIDDRDAAVGDRLSRAPRFIIVKPCTYLEDQRLQPQPQKGPTKPALLAACGPPRGHLGRVAAERNLARALQQQADSLAGMDRRPRVQGSLDGDALVELAANLPRTMPKPSQQT